MGGPVLCLGSALALWALLMRFMLRGDGERPSRYQRMTESGREYALKFMAIAIVLPAGAFLGIWAAYSEGAR